MKNIFIVPIAMIIAGCFSGEGVFQPPPKDYQMWGKPGVSEVGVQKALLECGYPEPFNGNGYGLSQHDFIEMDRCLLNDGFEYVSDRDWWNYNCPKGYRNDIACVRNYVPRKRSVQMRLGSNFCRNYPRAPACEQ